MVGHNLEEMFWSASLEREHFKDVSSGREKKKFLIKGEGLCEDKKLENKKLSWIQRGDNN